MKKKLKAKKKPVKPTTRTARAKQTLDERLSQVEQDVELNRRGLLALETRVSQAPTTEP